MKNSILFFLLTVLLPLSVSCSNEEPKEDFDRDLIITAKINDVYFRQYVEGAIVGNSIVATKRDVEENDEAVSITLYIPADFEVGKLYEMDYANPSEATCYAIFTDADGEQIFPVYGWVRIMGRQVHEQGGVIKDAYVRGEFGFYTDYYQVTEGKFNIKYR